MVTQNQKTAFSAWNSSFRELSRAQHNLELTNDAVAELADEQPTEVSFSSTPGASGHSGWIQLDLEVPQDLRGYKRLT